MYGVPTQYYNIAYDGDHYLRSVSRGQGSDSRVSVCACVCVIPYSILVARLVIIIRFWKEPLKIIVFIIIMCTS